MVITKIMALIYHTISIILILKINIYNELKLKLNQWFSPIEVSGFKAQWKMD